MKKRIALLLCLVMAVGLIGCGGSPKESYSIGVIQQLEHPALDQATQGFVDKLNELLGEENITWDVQNAQNEPTNCTTIANQMVSNQVDLILANATNALQAAAAATGEIPIIGTSVTDFATALDIPSDQWTGATGRNISGTTDLADLEQQANMLAELCPVADYPNVGLLYCSAEPNSVFQATEITTHLTALGYTVTAFTFADTNELASVTQNACDKSDVLYIPTDNTAAGATSTIDNVALPAGVPIIAGEEGIMAGCGIASLTISYYNLGVAAAEMAYDVLVNGADITTMAIKTAPQDKKYYPDRCDALGITVPEDYTAYAAE